MASYIISSELPSVILEFPVFCYCLASKLIPQHLKHYEATQSSSSAPKSTYIHVVTSRVTNVVQSTPFMLSLCALLKGITLNIQSSDLMSGPDVVCSV